MKFFNAVREVMAHLVAQGLGDLCVFILAMDNLIPYALRLQSHLHLPDLRHAYVLTQEVPWRAYQEYGIADAATLTHLLDALHVGAHAASGGVARMCRGLKNVLLEAPQPGGHVVLPGFSGDLKLAGPWLTRVGQSFEVYDFQLQAPLGRVNSSHAFQLPDGAALPDGAGFFLDLLLLVGHPGDAAARAFARAVRAFNADPQQYLTGRLRKRIRLSMAEHQRVVNPDACVDVAGWRDTEGHTCATYADRYWCTPAAGYGPKWDRPGAFSSYEYNGSTAVGACCSCGGGRPPAAPMRLQAHSIYTIGCLGFTDSFWFTQASSTLQQWRPVPVLTPAGSDLLSMKELFPFFARLIPRAGLQGAFLGRVLQHFGWFPLCILAETDEYSGSFTKVWAPPVSGVCNGGCGGEWRGMWWDISRGRCRLRQLGGFSGVGAIVA